MTKKISIKLINPVITRNSKLTNETLKKIHACCVSKTDFKVVFDLIVKGIVEFDEDPFKESLVHRLGRIVDIDYIEKNIVEKIDY